MRNRLLWISGASSLALIAACGSVEAPSSGSAATGSGGATATSTSSTGGSSTTGSSSSTAAGSSSTSTGSASTGSTGGGGGQAPTLFDCTGCLCDATTHYCRTLSGGPPSPPPGPPPEPNCPPDPGASNCELIPQQCSSDPTCNCLKQGLPCSCMMTGAAVTVTCHLP